MNTPQQYRPWQLHEIPLNNWFKRKNRSTWERITHVCSSVYIDVKWWTPKELLEYFEHSSAPLAEHPLIQPCGEQIEPLWK